MSKMTEFQEQTRGYSKIRRHKSMHAYLVKKYRDPNTGYLIKGASSKVEIEKNLGKEITLPPISDDSKETLGDVPSRYMTAVLDIGTMEKEPFVPKDPNIAENCDPFKIQSQSIMRYNVIFTQIMEMTIPYNANLRAGLTIECEFPRLDREKRAEKDTEMSGLYIIKELCHQFDSEGSFTKLKLNDMFLGITVVALGTSIPEVFVSIRYLPA